MISPLANNSIKCNPVWPLEVLPNYKTWQVQTPYPPPPLLGVLIKITFIDYRNLSLYFVFTPTKKHNSNCFSLHLILLAYLIHHAPILTCLSTHVKSSLSKEIFFPSVSLFFMSKWIYTIIVFLSLVYCLIYLLLLLLWIDIMTKVTLIMTNI